MIDDSLCRPGEGFGVTAGALLRQARQAAGLTQREVAIRAGVQQSVVSACASGGREPSLATLSSRARRAA